MAGKSRSLTDVLRKGKERQRTNKNPLWKGPSEDGITFSLLSRFLVCRERFRAVVVEGLKPADTFNHKLEFGSLWHEAEQGHAEDHGDDRWLPRVRVYADKLHKKYPLARPDIHRWAETVRVMFPVYVDFWRKHPDVKDREPVEQEQKFDTDIELDSGRIVKLRGKRDAGDLIGKRSDALYYLQENKTKSRIDETQIRRQLGFDLQSMMYIVAWGKGDRDVQNRLGGVRYNVVKRPEHRQGAQESIGDFIKRLQGIVEKEPEKFFMRWKVELSHNHVGRFIRECFYPILENLCDWWESITLEPKAAFMLQMERFNDKGFVTPSTWRHPFGVYNIIDEAGYSDYDNWLDTGSEVGLSRVTDLYPELAS